MRTMQWVMSPDALPLSYRRLKGAKALKLNVHCRFMWHTSCILLGMECLLLNHQHSKPNKANCGTSKRRYVQGLQPHFKSKGCTCMFLESIQKPCLVPGPHYCALPMRFGLRGPSKSPTLSSQIRHRRRHTGTSQAKAHDREVFLPMALTRPSSTSSSIAFQVSHGSW